MLRSILSLWKKTNSFRSGNGAATARRKSRSWSAAALESRTLLASLVSATKISYQDTDGDNVTVTLSKAVLTAGNVNSIFTFDVGTVDGSNTTKQQLRTINLTAVAGIAGTTITTAAVRSATTGGDGFAALGQINATGIDIGAVTIDGDLSRILAGDATTSTQGVGALKVHSMGRFGTLSGATNLETVIQGKLASLTTKSDVKDCRIRVIGEANGQIGSVTIGGSLIGGAADNSGLIFAEGDLGPVNVTGDVNGGDGDWSGGFKSDGKISSVTVKGTIAGGEGSSSGVFYSKSDIGAVNVTGSVLGESYNSGRIQSEGKVGNVTIGGSLVGSQLNGRSYSGMIYSKGDMGVLTITGDVVGGAGDSGGSIQCLGKLTSVTIGGSLIGGSDPSTGQVYSNLGIGAVKINGNILGGNDDPFAERRAASGIVYTEGAIASVTVGGSLRGGIGGFNGSVCSLLDIGAVNVSGSVEGGLLQAEGSIASVTIGGSLIGRVSVSGGRIRAGRDMGPVNISKDIIGVGDGGADISCLGNVASVTIGGSLIGGGRLSGVVSVLGELTKLTIGGDIRGGSASGVTNLANSGTVIATRIGTLTLNGSLIAGTDNTSGEFTNSGAIRVRDDIANLTIKGNVIGNSTNKALITARGQLTPSGSTDLAIGKLTINGRVEYGLIVAGSSVEPTVTSANADAQIGPVVIGGDWIASSLIAGAAPGVDGRYGTADDVKMSGGTVKDVSRVSSKITSIVIGGQVMGTPTLVNDHFGFVAENIGSFKVKAGTTTYSLIAGNSNDDIVLSIKFGGLIGDDTRLNEI